MKDLKTKEEKLDKLYQSIFKLAENRDLRAMISRCEEVHDLAAKLNRQDILGLSYKYKGFAQYSLNEIDKAIKSYETAELIFESSDLIKELIGTKLSLGVLYRNLGELKMALAILKDSLALSDKYELPYSTIQNNIGLIYAAQNEHEKALSFYLKAIEIERSNLTPAIGQIVRYQVNCAGMYIHLQADAKAEGLYKNSIQYCKEHSDYDFLIVSLKGMANLCIRQQRYSDAEEMLIEVKDLSKKLNFHVELLEIVLYLANLRKFLKKPQEQLALLLEAWAIAKESYHSKESEVLKYLLIFYEEHKNWKLAFRTLKELNQIQVANFEKEKQDRFIEFQQKFESEQKDRLLNQQRNFNIELKAKNQELAEANEDLEQFNHGVSHDLKEPLRLIKGRLTFLKLRVGEKLDTEEISALESGLQAASRMEKMLEDLYKFSSLGKNLREEGEIDLNEVLAIVQADLQMRIKENNALITFSELPMVKGYKSMYVQLFQNLINNSLKFRRPELDPQIEISYNKEDKWHVISVQDNGMGIREQNLSKIFKLFKRLDESKHIEGSGVGLSIVQKIVKKMQGEISLASDINKGTQFVLRIPKN